MIDIDTLLTRKATAEALKDYGYPVAPTSLATLASRGCGPVFRRFGSKPLYRWGDVLAWVRDRTGPPLRSTSASDAKRRPLKAAPSELEAL